VKPRLDDEFQNLYFSEFDRVYRAAFAISINREEAEDAAQEAFARALDRWPRLRGMSWNVGWIMKTAANEAIRTWRRRSRIDRFLRDTSSERETDPAEILSLRQAVISLPRRQREAVVLFYLGDLPVREVASAMNCAEGTVKALLSQARSNLRYGMEGDDGPRNETQTGTSRVG
jgi:RNA polymerase sigma-70 factor, ECF subfamily